MVNIRKKDGAYRPIKPKDNYDVLRDYDEIFIHSVDTVKNWIGWGNDNLYWFTENTETVIGPMNVDSVKIQSVGFVLVIYTKTGNDVHVYYSLFDKTTNSYGQLVDFEFEIPDIVVFQKSLKYNWLFYHRVVRNGVPEVNLIGLKVTLLTPGATRYQLKIVYIKNDQEIEYGFDIPIVNPTTSDYLASSVGYPSLVKFFSTDGVLYFTTEYNHWSTGILEKPIYSLTYDNVNDIYANGVFIDDRVYNSIGEVMYPTEKIRASYLINDTDSNNISENIDVSSGANMLEKYAIVEGVYLKYKELAQKNGFFEGFTYITYAFKLFDGSYIKYSFPKLIYIGNEDVNLSVFGKIISNSVSVTGFEFKTIGIYINSDLNQINDIISKYDKLIVSLDIFMTAPISRFDFSKHEDYVQQGSKVKELNNFISFYNVYSIPIKDLAKFVSSVEPVANGKILYNRITSENRFPNQLTQGYINGYDDNLSSYIDLNSIATFEAMPVDNYTAHVRYADSIFKYNNRLMISDTIQKLYKGFSPLWFMGVENSSVGNTDYVIYFEVVIETEEGIKYVRSDGWSTRGSYATMPQFFGYPDNRATKFMAIGRRISDNITKILIEVELTKHLTHNFSYYLAPELYQQYILELKSNNIFEIKETVTIPLDDANWTGLVTPTYPTGALNLVVDKNKISITEVNNPFIFPAKYTYQVGNSEILGLASNADPVSQGQFGQYPIIVFTKTGIWTLNISESDQIYISNITPLNGEVCTNKESISNIAGSVMFVSGKYIKLLKGGTVNIISDILNGAFESKARTEAYYTQIIDSVQTFDFPSALCQVDFEDYISGAKFGYDRNNEEFIVTNSDYQYSFVFNGKIWYKISQSFDKIVMDYPECYGVNAETISNLSEEMAGNANMYLETQAIIFSEDGFTKLDRIRIELTATNTTGSLGIYILGSIDGEKWAVVNGKEYGAGNITNPILNKTHASLKYLKLIISAKSSEIELRNIITDLEIGYQNKLR